MIDVRKSGLDVIGDVPWGMHLCLFYQTKGDLLDILVPYFKAGLENNEFCMWLTSEPLRRQEAMEAMKKAVADFDQYLRRGQIEIIPHTDWYLKGGSFDRQRVLDGLVEKLNQAISNCFEGLRGTGNTFWLKKRDWKTFADYEEAINSVISKNQIMAICTYSLDKCGGREILDVVRNHQSALIRSGGKWDVIESLEHKEMRQALQKSKEHLHMIINGLGPQMFVGLMDIEGKILFVNRHALGVADLQLKDVLGKPFEDTYWWSYSDVVGRRLREVIQLAAQGTPVRYDEQIRAAGGQLIWIDFSLQPLWDENGKVVFLVPSANVITERKQAEGNLQLYSKELEETNSALKVLLRQRENDRKEMEEKVLANVKQLILPHIDILKRSRQRIPEDVAQIRIMESNLNEIVSSFSIDLFCRNLTPKEMLIANLIKEGLQDKDIAGSLNLSIDTVKAHRRNIRRKLGITGKKINLRSFLYNYPNPAISDV